MRIPITLALAVLIASMGAAYFLEDRYQTVQAAAAAHAYANGEHRSTIASIVLAQAQSAAELTRDIEALRLQNVIHELESIDARVSAGRPFPTDATRRDQLLAQMAAIIKKLER